MNNDKFAQYIQNFNRRLRFTGAASSAKIDERSYRSTEFYRDSRDAFGVRFEVEKPNRDWLWMIPALIVSILAVVVMMAKVAA